MVSVGMTKTTFELYTLKKEQWQLDCVFNEKQDATNEAWRLLEAGHFDGVKVDQEMYDSDTNEAKVTTIFNRLKGEEKKAPQKREVEHKQHTSDTRVKAPKAKKSTNNDSLKDKGSAAGHFVTMLVTVCVILLVLIGIAYYIVYRF